MLPDPHLITIETSSLKSKSILTTIVTGAPQPTSVTLTPSMSYEDSVTPVSSLPHSSNHEKLYTSAFTSTPKLPATNTLSTSPAVTAPQSLQTSASSLALSPTPSSDIPSIDWIDIAQDRDPTIEDPSNIGGLEVAAKEEEMDVVPLLLLIFIIAVVVTCSLVLMLMLLGVYFRRRQSTRMRMAKFSSHHELSVFNPLYICPSILTEGVYQDGIQVSDFTNEHGLGISASDGSPMVQVPPLFLTPNIFPTDAQSLPEISSENLSEIEVLASGYFGKVVLAHTKGLCLRNRQLVKAGDGEEEETPITVAVKKLQSDPSQTQREAFDNEAEFMSHIKHPNVLRLLGVCHHDPAFIMMEFTEEGDLNQFLQSYSEIVPTTSPTSDTQIATSTLLYMASQISNAMQYLAAFDYVHRDIATRKCLVGKNFLVKLSDLGVNTNTYQSHYYCIRGNKLLPIRWMATESFSGKFSEKSDVWAFGVTMWELFTLAKDLPYPHLSDGEVIYNALQTEHFQPPLKPAGCPQAVYQIMQQCWAINLQHRATFQEVNEMFKTCV